MTKYRECVHRCSYGPQAGTGVFTTPCAQCDARILTDEPPRTQRVPLDTEAIRHRLFVKEETISEIQLLDICEKLLDEVATLRGEVLKAKSAPEVKLAGPVVYGSSTAYTQQYPASISYLVPQYTGGAPEIVSQAGGISFGLGRPQKL